MLAELTDRHDAIVELCRRFRVTSLAVFGSASRGEFDPSRSDVDFLIELSPPDGISRFDAYFGLKESLEQLLGRPVDLVDPSALDNPYFAKSVELTRRVLYAPDARTILSTAQGRGQAPNVECHDRHLPYAVHMAAQHVVDELGRYDGLTLDQLWPVVVGEVVDAVDPLEVILFGSVARGDDGPDSDIDLLIVFDHLDQADKRAMMARACASVTTFAPVDVLVSDVDEVVRRRDDVGSILYWPMREGRSVYRRPDVQTC